MAEGVSVPDNMAIRVIDRLFALVRNLDDSDSDWIDEGFEVLAALFDHPTVPVRLDALASDTNVRWSRRVSALEAFERLRGGQRAQLLLAELLPSVYGQSLHKCARIAVRLGQAAIDMVKRRVLQMVEEPDAGTNERTNAAEVMRILSLVTDVADLARSVLEDTRSTPPSTSGGPPRHGLPHKANQPFPRSLRWPAADPRTTMRAEPGSPSSCTRRAAGPPPSPSPPPYWKTRWRRATRW
jgi:hypothetical protein